MKSDAGTLKWPDYPCKECGWFEAWEVRRCINQAGNETFLFVCGGCGTRTQHFVPKGAVKAAGLNPEDIEPARARHRCVVCGVEGAESHHWAPSAMFGDAADRWPRSFLCRACHLEWHRRVTPNISAPAPSAHPLDITRAWPRELPRLLRHVESCAERVREAAATGDPAEWLAPTFAFATAASHLAAWVEFEKRTDLRDLRDREDFRIFRDFANAAKLVALDLDHAAQKRHPPIVPEATYTATATVTVALEGVDPPTARDFVVPKVRLGDGSARKLVEVVDSMVDEWRRVFRELCLTE